MYIGIDLGGTNIAGGVVNSKGDILKRKSIPTLKERGYNAVFKDLVRLVKELRSVSAEPIKGIGVGVPGVVDSNLEFIHYCPNLCWSKKNLGLDLSKAIEETVFVDNDANLAALAEVEAGALCGVCHGVMLTLGTGIGGGVSIDGRILRGSNGLGSEIGHMVIGENFYDCNCGSNGCFETFASATAVIRYGEKLIEENKYPESKLGSLWRGKQPQAKDVFDLAMKQDSLGLDVFSHLIKYLSIGVVNIINIFDPEKIAIGGGLAQAGDFLLTPLREEVKKRVFIKNFPSAEIVLAEKGNDAGIVGAAMLPKVEKTLG